MTKVNRFDGSKSVYNPSVHFVEREGKRFYRIWSDGSGEYITDEMSQEHWEDWQLCRSLLKTIRDDEHPRMFHFRDLGSEGWWTEEMQPSGTIEQHLRTGEYDFEAENLAALRDAKVALMAIQAYRAYVKSGGDPSQLPIMSFVCMEDAKHPKGVFTVNSEEENEPFLARTA